MSSARPPTRRLVPSKYAAALALLLALSAFVQIDFSNLSISSPEEIQLLVPLLLLGWLALRDDRLSKQIAGEHRTDLAKLKEARQAEREAHEARKEADASAAAKSSLLANLSHEIRTPMNGVIGFAQLLQSTQLDNEQRRYTELIMESGTSMVALLNDILDLAKIESGKMEMSVERTRLRDLVISASSLMKVSARRKGLVLNHEIAADLPDELMLDGLRVKQVLSNLLGNAVKFTNEGSIILKVSRSHCCGGPAVEFCVIDTGIGIPSEQHNAVFEQFVQVDGSSSRAHGGSGLGLPISRRLAELMGGCMSLESTMGKGTKVCLRIPLVQPEVRRAKTSPAAAPEPPARIERFAARTGRVLVAEDSDVNQILMQELLGSFGLHVAIADDGDKAVEMIEQAQDAGEPFDLVLMDVNMPNTDGLEATRQLRAAGYDGVRLPIIALTGSAYASEVEECFAVGMQQHLTKPVEQRDLIEALDRWLNPAALDEEI